MEYQVNNTTLRYQAEGEKLRGPENVLLDHAIDLTKKTTWSEQGFSIQPLFNIETYSVFENRVHELLIHKWQCAGLNPSSLFSLDQYHTIIRDFAHHLQTIEKTKLLNVGDFPVDIKILEERISEICQVKLEVKNPFDNQSVFHFRIIRPNTNDNNPLHRDVWLEDYDNCINLYIPIAGSNEDSSLILIPGSHRWAESKIEKTKMGAIINGVKFNVPAVTAIHSDFTAVRPNPGKNEVLIFSPYMIHGGAINLHPTKTRISIEVRLWKKS